METNVSNWQQLYSFFLAVSDNFIHDNSVIYLLFFLQGITPAKRRAIYFAAAKTLADVHKVDVSAVGLQKYGKRDNYCKRQVGLLQYLPLHF
jgi:hypothetical protein